MADPCTAVLTSVCSCGCTAHKFRSCRMSLLCDTHTCTQRTWTCLWTVLVAWRCNINANKKMFGVGILRTLGFLCALASAPSSTMLLAIVRAAAAWAQHFRIHMPTRGSYASARRTAKPPQRRCGGRLVLCVDAVVRFRLFPILVRLAAVRTCFRSRVSTRDRAGRVRASNVWVITNVFLDAVCKTDDCVHCIRMWRANAVGTRLL